MHRTTKLVLALAAVIIVLLGFGTLEYAWFQVKPSASSPLGQVQRQARIPATAPVVTSPAAPPVSSSPAPSAAVAPAVPTPPVSATTVIYVVQPHDTLWDLAGAHLGNPLRWQELYNLNRGRLEPGGLALVNSNVLTAGWTLELPADAKAVPAPQAPAASSGGQSA